MQRYLSGDVGTVLACLADAKVAIRKGAATLLAVREVFQNRSAKLYSFSFNLLIHQSQACVQYFPSPNDVLQQLIVRGIEGDDVRYARSP